MTRVREVSGEELVERREALLEKLEMSYEELAAKAGGYTLSPDEAEIWEEIRAIDFLLDVG